MASSPEHRKSSRYRTIAAELQKEIRLVTYSVARGENRIAALTMVRRYYGLREETFEVTVTTHPEGRYIYTMDMQRSRQSRI